MAASSPLKLGVDHKTKRVLLTIDGNGQKITAAMELDDIAELMAILSHCQLALAHSIEGRRVDLPMDAATAFQPVAGASGLRVSESIANLSVRDDPTIGDVVIDLMSTARRISRFRMIPEAARRLGHALLTAADNAESAQTATEGDGRLARSK